MTTKESKTADRSKNLSITTDMKLEAKLYSDQRVSTSGLINSPSLNGSKKVARFPSIIESNSFLKLGLSRCVSGSKHLQRNDRKK
jgi:hypothetical protein